MTSSTYQRSKHAVDPVWMEFTATHLPDAENFWITDVDTILRDRNGNMMLLELKYHGRDVTPQQRSTLLLLDQIIKAGLACLGGPVNVPGLKFPVKVNYQGVHLLQLSNNDFETGTILWDRKEITKEQLIDKLSFKEKRKRPD